MRRIILLPAFFYVSGIVLYINFINNKALWYLLLLVFTLTLALAYCRKTLNLSKKKTGVLFLCLVVGIFNTFAHYMYYEKGLESYAEGSHHFIVEIDKIEYGDSKVKIIGEVEGADGEPINGWNRIRLDCYSEKADLGPGDIISLYGECAKAKANGNPHCFDYKRYLLSQGICYTISTNEVQVEWAGAGTKKKLNDLKKGFVEYIGHSMGQADVAFVQGICFGDKSSIDSESLTWFQENGTAHVLAVSGLHIGILYLIIRRLLYKKHRVAFYIVIVFVLAFYGIITQWSVSVVRATMIIGVSLFAFILERPYDMTAGTAFVALVLLIINPFQIYSTGFQMSFLAVFSLSFFSTHIVDFIKKIDKREKLREGAISTLSTVISIQISMIIFSAYTFNYFSLISIFANIPTVLLISYLVPIVFLQFVSWALIGISPILSLSDILVKITQWLNRICWNDGHFTVVTESLWTVLIGFVLLLLFYLASEMFLIDWLREKKGVIVKTVGLIFLISLCLFANPDDKFLKSELVFVDVGQGDCIHVRTDEGDYLIDGGGKVQSNLGKSVLKPYLLKNGCKEVSGAIATHNHTDHYLGLCQLSDYMKIDRAIMSSGYREQRAEIKDEIAAEKFYFINNNDKIVLSDDAYITVLWPNPGVTMTDEEDENQVSLVLMLHYGDVKVLITGDIDEECEKMLLDKYGGDELKCDILKVAHHGSKYSTSQEFLDAVRPEIAVISVGKNNYGHPSDEVIARLRAMNCQVYRTDEVGAIGFNIKRKQLYFGRKEI